MNNEKKELEKLIDKYNYEYWVLKKPSISDQEFDSLILKLKKIDPSNDRIKKIERKEKLLSLMKVYSIDDVIKWLNKVSRNDNEEFIIQPKLDGMSGEINEKRLFTKGKDGEKGIDISNKIHLFNIVTADFKYIPLSTVIDKIGNIKGEMIIRKNIFTDNSDKFIRKNGENFKNIRSAIAGIVERKEINNNLRGLLDFVDFYVFSKKVKKSEIVDSIDYMNNVVLPKFFDYPTDGIVIRLADKTYGESLGSTSKFIKSAIALKPSNPTGITRLLDVEWSIGKNTLTPVGIVEPVEIANHINERVSLHNAKFIIENDIKIGDSIKIQKAGEIIPQFHSIIKKSTDRINPIIRKCPHCGTNLNYNEPELICSNENCNGKLGRKLLDSVRRIGVENIGLETINKLIKIGVNDICDILELKYDEIILLPKFADKSTKNLLNEIAKIKESPIEDWKILSLLNLKGIGSRLSKQICSKITLADIITKTKDELTQLDDIGPKRAEIIYNGLRKNIKILKRLAKIIKIIPYKKKIKSNQIIKICFTGRGKLPRKKYEEFCNLNEKLEFTKSITKDVDILITDNINKSSNKIKKANKYDIKIISYDKFHEFIMN
jgi:DNA ligase (NAD+)